MIEISLSRPKDNMPTATLHLPASRYDILGACAKLGVEDLNDAPIQAIYNDDIPKLNRSVHAAWNNKPCFDELNFLAARMQALSGQERFLLYGLAKIHDPQHLKDIINMTYNLEGVMVAGDIKDAEQLGRFLVENGFRDFPEKAIPYLDYAKIGANQLDENGCAIADGVYFEDDRDEITEVYDGMTLPKQPEEDWVFRVQIGNPQDADGSLLTELNLPATAEEMADALGFIKLSAPCEAVIVNFESRIADFAGRGDQQTDLSVLDDLAGQIARMDDAEYVKYRAVLEHEGYRTPEDMLACSYRLEMYTFMPHFPDAESFGRYMLDALDVPAQVKEYVNLHELGQSSLRESNMSLGSYGVIRPEYAEQTMTPAATPEEGMVM